MRANRVRLGLRPPSLRLQICRHTPSQRCKIERFDRIDRAEQREPFDDGETPHPGHHVRSMRIMAAAAALLLLLMLVSLAAAAPTNNTSDDTREREDRSVRESWRTFRKLKAEHGGNTDDGRSLTAKEEEERSYAWFKHRLGLIRHWWRDAGYSVFPWETGRCEEETRQLFAEWKVRHHKTYVSAAEDEHRYAIFKDTLRDVDQHNAGFVVGAHGYPLGVNEFSDITMEEFEESFSGGYIPELAARVAAGDGRVLAPSTVSPTATAVFA